MTGKTVVVTGASAGIGVVAAERLIAAGATVVPVGRSPEKSKAVGKRLGVEPLICDFAELDQVRALGAALLERCPQIDVLLNNAGGIFSRHVTTVDGNELTLQVNHLAPFLLTALLRERLLATAAQTGDARVINTSSVANGFGRVDPSDLSLAKSRLPYVAFRAYAAAKLENILFTRELARRYAGTGVTSIAVHPGNIASEFGRDSVTGIGLLYRTPLKRLFLISVEDGAAPLVSLATRPDAADFNGAYFDRFTPNGNTSGQANDPELAERLWDASAELVGLVSAS